MAESDAYNASWVPQPGTLLGERYEILGQLNRGGMGILLRAADRRMDREVAVKLISPKLSRTGNFHDRFVREVELATRIDHPNVIHCYDHGATEFGALYLVMELLDGFGLRELVRNEGRLSTSRTVALGIQLLRGLSAAHELGIVHRDLKPDNLYIIETSDGEVLKLLDFGLAKSLEDEQVRLTKTGMICGTAAYVAPETLVVEEPDKRADVYAVGLILLEMLFGRRVYPSNQMAQTFMEQLVIPARIPRRVWDEPLGRILSRALQKHPDERYADAIHMHKALAATAGSTHDFLLANDEIPPGANVLPKELLDDLADGRYRTIDTLHRLPKPEPWDPGDDTTRDRELLVELLDEISRSDIHAAFDIIAAGTEARHEPALDEVEDPLMGETRGPGWVWGVAFVALIAVVAAGAWVMQPTAPLAPASTPPPEAIQVVVKPAPKVAPVPVPSSDMGMDVGVDLAAATEVAVEPAAPPPKRKKPRPPAQPKAPAAEETAVPDAEADRLVDKYVPIPSPK